MPTDDFDWFRCSPEIRKRSYALLFFVDGHHPPSQTPTSKSPKLMPVTLPAPRAGGRTVVANNRVVKWCRLLFTAQFPGGGLPVNSCLKRREQQVCKCYRLHLRLVCADYVSRLSCCLLLSPAASNPDQPHQIHTRAPSLAEGFEPHTANPRVEPGGVNLVELGGVEPPSATLPCLRDYSNFTAVAALLHRAARLMCVS